MYKHELIEVRGVDSSLRCVVALVISRNKGLRGQQDGVP